MANKVAIDINTEDQLSYLPQVIRMVEKAGMEATVLSAADIINGELFNYDILLEPGGTGAFYGLRNYEGFNDAIRYFVANGGGYMGVCVPPETLIFTNPGVKQISQITEGDMVLSHKGLRRVTRIYKRPYKGTLVKIKTWGGDELNLTPEHPICAIHDRYGIGKHVGGGKFNQLSKVNPEWIEARDIKRGDLILLTIQNEVSNVIEIDITEYLTIPFAVRDGKIYCTRKWRGKQVAVGKSIPQKIPISNDFLSLTGLYLAEGFPSDNRLAFSFGKHEVELASFTRELLQKIFQRPAHIREANTALVVRVSSKILSNLFHNLFGAGAKNKHLPRWMMTLPHEKQKVLFSAYCQGDGSKDNKRERFSTVSQQLAYQCRQILYRLGKLNSIERRPAKLDFIQDRLVNCSERFGITAHFMKTRPSRFSFLDANFVYLPVRSMAYVPYEGEVYNLEVTEANSYTTVGGTLHNCGGAYVAGLRMTETMRSYCPRTLGIIDATIASPPWVKYIAQYRQAMGERVAVVCKITDEPHPIITSYQGQTIHIVYSGGPLIKDLAPDVIPLLTYVDDIMPPGDVALCCSVFGKGRVVISSPHPETPWGEELVDTGCQEWLYLNMLSWVSQPEEIAYYPFLPWRIKKRMIPYPMIPTGGALVLGGLATLGIVQIAKHK